MASNDQQLVDEIRAALRDVASSIDSLAWDDVCKKYLGRMEFKAPEAVVSSAMSFYIIGQEFNDKRIVTDVKKILSVKIPDLEERLPWYKLMFCILDNGTYCVGPGGSVGGPSYFELEPNTHKELTDHLMREAHLKEEAASLAVGRFARDMGFIPGAQYHSFIFLHGRPVNRPSEIALICQYLHMPLSSFMTVTGGKTAADSLFDSMRGKN